MACLACSVTAWACISLFRRAARLTDSHSEYKSTNYSRDRIASLLLFVRMEVPTFNRSQIFVFQSTQIVSFQALWKPISSNLSQPRSCWQLSDEWRIAGWWSWLYFSGTKFGRQQPSLEVRRLQPGKVKVFGYHWHSFLASRCNNVDYPPSSRCVWERYGVANKEVVLKCSWIFLFLLIYMTKDFSFPSPFVLIGRIKFLVCLQNEVRSSKANGITVVSGFVLFLICDVKTDIFRNCWIK